MEEQKTTTVTQGNKHNSKIVLYILAGLLAIVVLAIAIFVGIFIGRKYFPEEGTDVQNQEDDSTENTNVETEPTISISTPDDGDDVDGDIEVRGRATASLNQLTLRVYDNDSTMLSEETVNLEAEYPSTLVEWNVSLEVSTSPNVGNGFIVIFPTEEGEDSLLAMTVDINFAAAEANERVVLLSPLENQAFSGGNLFVHGRMKNFFEGVMNIRLKSNDGTIIFEDVIHANGDNYEDYVYFEKTVDAGNLPEGIDEDGVFQVYDVSMGDGSVNVILTIPMKLK